MNKLVAMALLAILPMAASAADRARLHVVQSITINAPAAKVWGIVGDFAGLHNWHPLFAKDVIIKGKNGQVGAVRQLTIKDGPSFTEELLGVSANTMSYTYDIVESPLPLTDYVSSMVVVPVSSTQSTIEWQGSFRRKNDSANPPKGEGDDDVVGLITGAYKGGLENVKVMAER